MQKRLIFCLTVLLVLTNTFSYAEAEPKCNRVNGHCYEYISKPNGISWSNAVKASNNRVYKGVRGHLATVTSDQEFDFIYENVGMARSWLGGFQPPGTPEPDEGWEWITGEPWGPTFWAARNPNDESGNEDRLGTHRYGKWVDLPEYVGSWIEGFVVEYPLKSPPDSCNGELITIVGTDGPDEIKFFFFALYLSAFSR